MLQFHLSKILAGDMKSLITEPAMEIDLKCMQWYGHRITVLRRKCVLMMEFKSRYCMVFTGMTKKDFDNFPALFIDRLWREVNSICELDDELSAQLVTIVHIMTEQQQFQVGSDRSVQSHLRQAADEFSDFINYQTRCLPERGEQEFACGVRLNERLRKCKEDADYFRPLEEFRHFWLEILNFSQQRLDSDSQSLPDNVIPFPGTRRT